MKNLKGAFKSSLLSITISSPFLPPIIIPFDQEATLTIWTYYPGLLGESGNTDL